MKKILPKPPKNPKMQKCAKCKIDLAGLWWIQIGYRVYCKKHYKLELKSK